MKTPHLAMVAIPDRDDGAVIWGSRTPDELLHEPVKSASDPATGIVVYQGAPGRDIEEPQRAQLVATAACVLRSPSFRKKIRIVEPHSSNLCSLWFLVESGNRLRVVEPDAVPDATNALLVPRQARHARVVAPALVHFVTKAPTPGITVDALLAAIARHLEPLTTPCSRNVRGEPAIRLADDTPDTADQRAIESFRESLLAQDWPDSQTVGRQLGSTPGAGAESRVSRARSDGKLFGVWAGRERGGYRHPPFQFLPSGSVHSRLPELIDALARRPDLSPIADRSGWERAFWLYQPRGRLSVQALALRAAAPAQLRADPERFAALPTTGRTPADVFPQDPQAVIDLARDDAAANIPPEVDEADRHG